MKLLSETGLGELILKIKAWGAATFLDKTDVEQTTTIGVDSAPTAGSTNLVTSGGVKTALDEKQDVAPTITISYAQVVSADPMIIQMTDAQAAIMDDPDVISVNFDATGIGFGVVTMNKAVGDDDPLSYCGYGILPGYYAVEQTISDIVQANLYIYVYSPGDKRAMLKIDKVVDFDDPFAHVSDLPTVPTALSELSGDATHRLVTDTEKATWNGKQDAGELTIGETTYELRVSTTDAGQAGYITFVTEE